MSNPRSDTCDSVLFIDDDKDLREVVSIVLGDAGCKVTTVESGEKGLEYLRSEAPPCLILLDLMMPEMDGYEFRAEQLQDPALAKIPTVVLTAGAITPEMGKLTATRIVLKPLELASLLAMISEYRAAALR